MFVAMSLPLMAAIHGAAAPVLWIIGIILIIAGIVALVRHSLILGIVLVVLGILLGGLNIF